jgi:signal peptide peptidase SppA
MKTEFKTWAILPAALNAVIGQIATGTSGNSASAEVPPSRFAATRGSKRKVDGQVVVIPIRGVLVPRMGTWGELGGISTERIGRWLDDALSDPNVGAIILDIDSPGGLVEGTPELAAQIYAAREAKPIIAVANMMATSAAYWIGSAASELIVSPSGTTGSIGVVVVHTDWSAALAQAGLKVTILTAGAKKAEGNPYEPLDDDARNRIQELIEADYSDFIGAVAKYRGLNRKQVIAASNEARTLTPGEALSGGLINRIADMKTVMAEFGMGPTDKEKRNRMMLADLSLAEAEANML